MTAAPAIQRGAVVLACALAAAWPGRAAAQAPERQIDTSRGPTSELYIRKRPPAPEAPVLSAELKTLLASTEKKRDDKRLEAIGLLRAFLDSKPTGESRAEGMFKLAELLWEESRRLYLIKMDEFSRALEKPARRSRTRASSPRSRGSTSTRPRRCTSTSTSTTPSSAGWIS